MAHNLAEAQEKGLYNPANEHDACGIGFIAHIKGEKKQSSALGRVRNLHGRAGCHAAAAW